MKKIAFLILLFASIGYAQNIGPGLVKIQETDGSPAGWVKKITVPNTSLSITGADATLIFSGEGGQPITLDLGDDGGDDSVALGEIATSGDTNSIFTEPADNKLLIDLTAAWPVADTLSDVLTHELGGLEADVSAYSGLVKISEGATSQAAAGTDYVEPTSAVDQTYDDGTGDSPSIFQINEANQYSTMILTAAGGLHIDNNIGGGSYIGLFPGATSNIVITPTTDGYGIYLSDVGNDSAVTMTVPDGTDDLAISGDLKFADGKQILDASGNPVVQINDGQEFEIIGTLKQPLAENYLLQGNSSGQAAEVSSLANVSFGGFTASTIISADASGYLTSTDIPAAQLESLTAGALNWYTTGTIAGALVTATDADAHTLTVAEYHGGTVKATGAAIYTLPAAAAGLSGCVENGYGVTSILQLLPAAGDYIVHKGARGTAATSIKSPTGVLGSRICYRAYDDTDWYVTTSSATGAWAE